MRRQVVLLLVGLLALPATGCDGGGPASTTPQPTPTAKGETFEFSSGGAHQIQGYGEWTVRLDEAGAFSISHDVRGSVKDYGTHSLAQQENTDLWTAVRAADIGSLQSSSRLGVPDEVQYTFSITDGGQTHTASIWVRDALQNDKIAVLVDNIAGLIEKYTGEKPVVR